MNYPLWEIPYIGSQLIIAIVAITHVFMSHFAVGGGIYLPITEKAFSKANNAGFMDYLKKFTRFFVVITSVLGVVTGIGIWFTIGLTNPETTSALIHTYAFMWAIEWVFFLVEIIALIVYYYGFNFLSKRNHQIVGWIYLVSSYMSLFIINGILTFMLTPGDWLTSKDIFDGFFNPTFWPSLFVRTLGTLILVSFFSIFVASRLKDQDLRGTIIKYNSKWIIPSMIGMVICLLWYYLMLPERNQELIILGFSNIGSGNYSILTRVITLGFVTFLISILFVYFSAYLNSKNIKPYVAAFLLVMGLIIIGSFEFSREMLRKPYSISNYIFSNSNRTDNESKLLKEGILKNIKWTSIKEITNDNKILVGKELFRNQCLSCHTKEYSGYRSVTYFNIKASRDKKALSNFITMIRERDPKKNSYLKFMPAFLGNDAEAEALVLYLEQLQNDYLRNKHVK